MRLPIAHCLTLLVAVMLLPGCGSERQQPEPVLVAVASNFVPALSQLQPLFEASGNYRLSMSVGSTGKLYAQIHAGAPYDVLLAADQERPRLLEQEGHAVERFVYAHGQLVLWRTGAHGENPLTPLEQLRTGQFSRLALANPELAPYGQAARSTLGSLGLLEQLTDKLVFGENLGQAHAMLATGNADLGFTAAAFLPAGVLPRQVWRVPTTEHTPIVQEAVLLQRAAQKPAAIAFITFLQSPEARELIAKVGYSVPSNI